MMRRALPLLAGVALALTAAMPAVARDGNADNAYTVTPLVSNLVMQGVLQDTDLVNGWGITAGPISTAFPQGTPWWVSDNGTDKSTLYRGTGAKVPLTVNVAGAPTGTVFNLSTNTSDFLVSAGGVSAAARFLFATEGGTIRGWNPNVPAAGSTDTEIVADRSDVGAIYKGLAIDTTGGNWYLYANDFHNDRIDVFNGGGTLQSWTGAFVDPGLPGGFAPFGIQNIGGTLFVTYAKQDAEAKDEVAGEGLGFVDAFGADGSFLGRVASGDELNAPWGLAWAPSSGFGKFSGDLLVGNFGDGRISAYALSGDGWEARGLLKGNEHRPLSIDGLWGIGFGNGAASGATNVLYFAAGPNDENDGLFGTVTASGS